MANIRHGIMSGFCQQFMFFKKLLSLYFSIVVYCTILKWKLVNFWNLKRQLFKNFNQDLPDQISRKSDLTSLTNNKTSSKIEEGLHFLHKMQRVGGFFSER